MPIEIVLPVPLVTAGTHAADAPQRTFRRKTLPPAPVVALVDNTKARAAEILDAIGRQLVRRGAAASYFVWRKPSPAKPITAQERDALLSRADVVIAGVGD